MVATVLYYPEKLVAVVFDGVRFLQCLAVVEQTVVVVIVVDAIVEIVVVEATVAFVFVAFEFVELESDVTDFGD